MGDFKHRTCFGFCLPKHQFLVKKHALTPVSLFASVLGCGVEKTSKNTSVYQNNMDGKTFLCTKNKRDAACVDESSYLENTFGRLKPFIKIGV